MTFRHLWTKTPRRSSPLSTALRQLFEEVLPDSAMRSVELAASAHADGTGHQRRDFHGGLRSGQIQVAEERLGRTATTPDGIFDLTQVTVPPLNGL